jgi:DnaK suppressor protein
MASDHDAALDEVESALDGVDAALARLADGSYGVCAVCGEPIPDERLAAAPAASDCGRHPT